MQVAESAIADQYASAIMQGNGRYKDDALSQSYRNVGAVAQAQNFDKMRNSYQNPQYISNEIQY